MKYSMFSVAIACSVALSIATVLNFIIYTTSWKRTILAFPTIDLNVLSDTLPTNLSSNLQKSNREELQRTLNSNAVKLSLVVTDCKTEKLNCPSQQILYTSESSQSWEKNIQVTELPQHPYAILRNPVEEEKQYEQDYDIETEPTVAQNQGEIIGRVYYIRNLPPRFIEDYSRWLQNPFDFSGVRLSYYVTVVLSLTGGVAVGVVWSGVIYKTKIQRRLSEQREYWLSEYVDKLIFQLEEQLQQNSFLESKLSELLNTEQQNRQTISQLWERAEQEQQELTDSQNKLNSAQSKAQQGDRLIVHLRDRVESLQQELTDQQEQLNSALSRAQRDREIIAQLENKLAQNHQAIAELQNELALKKSLEQELEKYQRLAAQYESQIDNLLNELAAKERETAEYVELLERDNQRLEQVAFDSERLAAGRFNRVEALEAEKSRLLEQLKQVNRKRENLKGGIGDDFEESAGGNSDRYAIWFDDLKDLEELQRNHKVYVQVMAKILSLQAEPRPYNSTQLNKYGHRNVYRIRSGEYRICYTIEEHSERSSGEIRVLTIGKKNDGEIYLELMRRLG